MNDLFPRQLAQVRPAGTAAVNGRSSVNSRCANVSGASIDISIYHSHA